jgi:hypothetical protein
MRQQRGANGTVRGGEHPTDRSRKSVHRSKTGIREGQSAEKARQRHVFAPRDVTAICKCHR